MQKHINHVWECAWHLRNGTSSEVVAGMLDKLAAEMQADKAPPPEPATDRLATIEQRLADLERSRAADGEVAHRLGQCLAETDEHLENLAAAMREVARKDSIHPSVRFLADTIAINLTAPAAPRDPLMNDPPGMPLTSSVGPLENDTSGRWLRMWSYPGAGNRVWGSEAEARAAAWEDYDASR